MRATNKSNRIRLAAEKDIPDLVALENRCFDTDRLTISQLRRFIRGDTALIMVCEDQQRIIASAVTLFRKNSNFARLYSLAVDPAWKGHGYATLLHQTIEAAAQTHGCDEMRLEVRYDNPRAIHFYTQLGYTRFGEYKSFYEDGADALRMRKIK